MGLGAGLLRRWNFLGLSQVLAVGRSTPLTAAYVSSSIQIAAAQNDLAAEIDSAKEIALTGAICGPRAAPGNHTRTATDRGTAKNE